MSTDRNIVSPRSVGGSGSRRLAIRGAIFGATHKPCFTLAEVVLATAIMVIGTVGAMTAIAAGHSAAMHATARQLAGQLAINMLEEIKLFPIEDPDGFSDGCPMGVTAGARACFDDKFDFNNYIDGSGVTATHGQFVNHFGTPIRLSNSDSGIKMYRHVSVTQLAKNDFLTLVRVRIYPNNYGETGAEPMVELVRVFGLAEQTGLASPIPDVVPN